MAFLYARHGFIQHGSQQPSAGCRQTIQQAATAAQAQITMLSRPQMTTVHDSAGSRATPAQGQKLSGVVEAAVEASSKESKAKATATAAGATEQT